MEDDTQERTPRELESRNNVAREQQWSPPPILPDPNPQPGWTFRYIRTSMTGQSDATNVSMRFREGWEHCVKLQMKLRKLVSVITKM